jgi:hypothetical protein
MFWTTHLPCDFGFSFHSDVRPMKKDTSENKKYNKYNTTE